MNTVCVEIPPAHICKFHVACDNDVVAYVSDDKNNACSSLLTDVNAESLCAEKIGVDCDNAHDYVVGVPKVIAPISLPTETIRQHILPRSHFVTRCIVLHEHQVCNYFGANYVISKLMQKFWLCGGVATVRNFLTLCMYGKIRRAESETQLMGDLPTCHVAIPKFPFHFAGCNLFEPMLVKVNRSVVKRWGVSFVCMFTRACYIDIVLDLTTNSFIQCFWHFTCCRGLYCRCLFTDQGTNFVGCNAKFEKLRKHYNLVEPTNNRVDAWHRVDCDRISQCLLHKGVDVCWHFNTARNPHAGGSW